MGRCPRCLWPGLEGGRNAPGEGLLPHRAFPVRSVGADDTDAGPTMGQPSLSGVRRGKRNPERGQGQAPGAGFRAGPYLATWPGVRPKSFLKAAMKAETET